MSRGSFLYLYSRWKHSQSPAESSPGKNTHFSTFFAMFSPYLASCTPSLFPVATEIRFSYLVHIAAGHRGRRYLEPTCSKQSELLWPTCLIACVPFPFPIKVCAYFAKELGFSLCSKASAHLLHTRGTEASVISQLVLARAGRGLGDRHYFRLWKQLLHSVGDILRDHNFYLYFCSLGLNWC